MKIQAHELQKGMVIQYGHEKKRIKEILYTNGMVQLTLADLLNRKKSLACLNVCVDFEFKVTNVKFEGHTDQLSPVKSKGDVVK